MSCCCDLVFLFSRKTVTLSFCEYAVITVIITSVHRLSQVFALFKFQKSWCLVCPKYGTAHADVLDIRVVDRSYVLDVSEFRHHA